MREKNLLDVKKRQFLLISHSYGPSKLCPPPPLSFLLHSPPHQLPCEKHLPSPLRKRRLARLELFRSANLLREGIGRAENNQLRELESECGLSLMYQFWQNGRTATWQVSEGTGHEII